MQNFWKSGFIPIWILYLGHLKPFSKKIIDFFFILGFHLGYCSLFQCYGHICRAPILRSVFTLWKQIANSGSKFQRIFNFGTSLGRLRLFVALHKGRKISEGVFNLAHPQNPEPMKPLKLWQNKKGRQKIVWDAHQKWCLFLSCQL